MSVILDALKKAQESRKQQAAPTPPSRKPGPTPHRKLAIRLAAGALALLVVGVLAFLLFSGPSTKDVVKVTGPQGTPPPTAAPSPVKAPVTAAAPQKAAVAVTPPDKEPEKPQGRPATKEKGDWRTDKPVAEADKAPRPERKKMLRPVASPTVETATPPRTVAQGRQYEGRERPARRDLYESAPGRDQSAFDAAQDRGAALAEAGKLGEARQVYTKLLLDQPGHPEILNNLGVIALREKRIDEALYYFSKALDKRRDYPKVLNNVGLALMARGDQEDAETYFKRAIAAEPDSPEPRLNLAALLRRQGKLEEASLPLKGLVEKDTSQPRIFLSYALIRDDAGDRADAVRYYRKYLVNAPPGQERSAVIERLKVLENAQSPGSR